MLAVARVPLFALSLVLAGAAQAVVIDIDSRNPAGVTLAGFATTDILDITWIDNRAAGGYAAWNAWGSTTCVDPLGCPSGSATGWLNSIQVVRLDDATSLSLGVSLIYASPDLALAGAVPGSITGSTAYQFVVPDNIFGDNLGGISLSIDVRSVPEVASVALLASASALLAWIRRKARAA